MILYHNMFDDDHKKRAYPLLPYEDQDILKFLSLNKHHAIVAGGAALSWYQDRAVGDKDIDIWFNNQSSFDRMSKYLEAHSARCRITYNTENAQTWSVDVNTNSPRYKIQLIKNNFWKDPKDIIQEFDFTVCQIATDGFTWYHSDNFCQDLKDRKLRTTKIRPLITKRLLKYWIYGFQPDDQLIQQMIDHPDTVWDYSKSTDEDYADAI